MAKEAESPKTKVKVSAKKNAAPKKSAAHPPYNEMVDEAIKALKERGGSSRQAILGYILKNYDVGDNQNNVNVRLKLSLKKGVESKKLKQVKGKGASGSFRIGDSVTTKSKVQDPAKPKQVEPKSASAKKESPAKKATVKKTAVKKSAAKAPAAKKTVAKKVAAKKPAAKKPAAKKPTVKSKEPAAKK